MTARGRFITLEGGEGAGKSTQLRMLAEALRRHASVPELICTREPGGSAGAEQIRNLLVTGRTDRWTPTTEALMHFAARRDHLDRTIWPALARGDWVLSDRFADSTRAYQGYGLGLGLDWVDTMYQLVIGAFAPDLTLILDLPAEIGVARARQRLDLFDTDEDRYERMEIAFHQRLRDGFLAVAEREPDRCAVIDASGSIDEVQAAIRKTLRQRLGLSLHGK